MKKDETNNENLKMLMDQASQRVLTNVSNCVEAYDQIRWVTRKVIIPLKPSPSKRPRLSGQRIYVPGAAKNASFFNKNVLPQYKSLFIVTPCEIDLDIYVETPESFTDTQKILAEMKILRPWSHTGDVDNYTKSALDCVQPNNKRKHRGIMYDDCLVISCNSKKYYSITPRYEMYISYMTKIPPQLETVLRTKKFSGMKPEEY